MAGDTTITIIGNTTSDPELRFTPSGHAVANLTIASTPRSYDKNTQAWVDGETLFMRCSIWREAAENVAESITRGMRVVATGRLKQRSFEKDGQKRTVVEMELDEIGPSLRYATARVTKTERNQGGQQQPTQQGGDPWTDAGRGQAPQGQGPGPRGGAPQGDPQGGGWGGKPRESQSGPPSHEGWGQAPPSGQSQGRIPNQPLPAKQQGGGWVGTADPAPF